MIGDIGSNPIRGADWFSSKGKCDMFKFLFGALIFVVGAGASVIFVPVMIHGHMGYVFACVGVVLFAFIGKALAD